MNESIFNDLNGEGGIFTSRVLKDKRLRPNAKFALLGLMKCYYHVEARCTPSREEISQESGVHISKISTCLRDLQQTNWISIEKQKSGKRNFIINWKNEIQKISDRPTNFLKKKCANLAQFENTGKRANLAQKAKEEKRANLAQKKCANLAHFRKDSPIIHTEYTENKPPNPLEGELPAEDLIPNPEAEKIQNLKFKPDSPEMRIVTGFYSERVKLTKSISPFKKKPIGSYKFFEALQTDCQTIRTIATGENYGVGIEFAEKMVKQILVEMKNSRDNVPYSMSIENISQLVTRTQSTSVKSYFEKIRRKVEAPRHENPDDIKRKWKNWAEGVLHSFLSLNHSNRIECSENPCLIFAINRMGNIDDIRNKIANKFDRSKLFEDYIEQYHFAEKRLEEAGKLSEKMAVWNIHGSETLIWRINNEQQKQAFG